MTEKHEKHELEYDPAGGVEMDDTFGIEHIIVSRDIEREIEVDKMSNIHIPNTEFSHREFELEQRIKELEEELEKCEDKHMKLLDLTQTTWIKKNEALQDELDEQKDMVRKYQSSAVKDSKIMRQQHDLLQTFADRYL
jgi:hypothetical protein